MPLKPGEQLVLAEVNGASGTIRRIWLSVLDRGPRMLRGLRIDRYWDGARTPAVSAPLGDFFGVGLGRSTSFEPALFSNPEGRSFNCFIPVPFRTGMKIVVTNESGRDLSMLFYDVHYTLGDKHGTDVLYFHAHWRRGSPTAMQKNYEILPRIEGAAATWARISESSPTSSAISRPGGAKAKSRSTSTETVNCQP